MSLEIEPITTADGLELHLAFSAPTSASAYTLIGTHGINSNFYQTPLLALGRRLAADGHGFAILNNRGHDRINSVSGKTLGTAYETFDDCVLDFSAAMDWLQARGHTRLILAGHSLGALKAAYMQAFHPRPPVHALAYCSGPALVEEHSPAEFQALLAQAQQLVAAGRGNELIMARPPADRPMPLGPFAATTYVDKYLPGAKTKTLDYVTNIQVPTLFIAGSKEPQFARHAQALFHVQVASPSFRPTLHIIDGATHNYEGFEDELAGVFRSWIATLPPKP